MPNNPADFHFKIIGDRRLLLEKQAKVRWSVNYEDYLIIPSGVETDFASVPMAFWSILPPMGKYNIAALTHDYLYQTQGLNGYYEKDDCDTIFKRIMQYDGVSAWKVFVMFNAVKYFGGHAWNNYK